MIRTLGRGRPCFLEHTANLVRLGLGKIELLGHAGHALVEADAPSTLAWAFALAGLLLRCRQRTEQERGNCNQQSHADFHG